MHVLVDTNVLLDLLLQREPWHQDAEALFEAHLRGDWELYFTATTLTDVFYIARREVGVPRAFQAVELCLDQLFCVPVGSAALRQALSLAGDDFEDNVQITLAVEKMLDVIVTRDVAGFQHSPVRTLTPAQLLSELSTHEAQQ